MLLVELVVDSVGLGCLFLTGAEFGALHDGSHSSDNCNNFSSSLITCNKGIRLQFGTMQGRIGYGKRNFKFSFLLF